MRRLPLLLILILGSCPHPLHAQVSRRDLEDIERHRKPRQAVPVLQSIDDPSDSLRWDSSLIGTWDFLDEEERRDEEEAESRPEERIRAERSDLELRLSVLPEELMVPYNDILEQQVNSYVVRHAGGLRGILGKYRYHERAFRTVFRQHGIPEDLTALAIVESAMNPLALSPAGARGMWQFMPATARQYGLRCDSFLDERLDIYKSADAAARYLKAAYARFGNWPLAVSSYNCGPQNVENAIRKAGSMDFWDVYPYLPAETKAYMPAFIAALYSVYFHELHGIEPRAYSEGAVTSFRITRDMTFKEVIRATGVEQADLVRLNPQYLTGIIPGNDRDYILRLPRRFAKLFKDNIDVVTN